MDNDLHCATIRLCIISRLLYPQFDFPLLGDGCRNCIASRHEFYLSFALLILVRLGDMEVEHIQVKAFGSRCLHPGYPLIFCRYIHGNLLVGADTDGDVATFTGKIELILEKFNYRILLLHHIQFLGLASGNEKEFSSPGLCPRIGIGSENHGFPVLAFSD